MMKFIKTKYAFDRYVIIRVWLGHVKYLCKISYPRPVFYFISNIY